MDFLIKYGILTWIFLGKAFEYFMYFSLFLLLLAWVCIGNIENGTTKMLPWVKDPSIVLHVATLCFVTIISFKQEHLSKTNLVVLILAFFGFIFGYYGVPEFMQFK